MTKESYSILNFQGILGMPKRIIEKIKYSRSLPKNHLIEDVFLVSYPKSGNTWLRFLIANAIKVHHQIDKEVNFFSIVDMIPEIRLNGEMKQGGPFGRTDIPRIIKSHSPYNPYYYRVIWLVRDPRDVMVSYYYYLRWLKRISEDTDISEFIRQEKYGINNWIKHTESWYFYTGIAGGQIVKMFRYEDFIKDTYSQLAMLMELLGINISDQSLKQAIELSSKERMKDLEKRQFPNHTTSAGMSFVRRGTASGGQELSDTDSKFIENLTQDIAQMLGYTF
jgi:hypothetical protein